MKITTLIHILLICSLVMLLPPLENDYSTTLFPDTEKSIVINIHTPQLKFTSDKLVPIGLNVSYMDPITNKITRITQPFNQFTSKSTIETSDPGSYLIEMFSGEIVNIKIETSGIYTTTIVIILVLLIIDVILLARNYLLVLDL